MTVKILTGSDIDFILTHEGLSITTKGAGVPPLGIDLGAMCDRIELHIPFAATEFVTATFNVAVSHVDLDRVKAILAEQEE